MTPLNIIWDKLLSIFLDHILFAPKKRLEMYLFLLERLSTAGDGQRNNFHYLRELLQSGHPFPRFLKRLNSNTSRLCRKSLISNLIVRSLLRNRQKRKNFKRREGFLPPFSVSFAPTSRCNLNCEHCSATPEGGDDLDPDLMVRIIKEAKARMGIHFFILTGGEPLLYPDLFGVISSFPSCYFQIFTNGTLLNSENVRRFSQLGNILPMLSVEGNETLTDHRRSSGTYRKVEEAMHRLNTAGVPFGYSVMTTRENWELVTASPFVDRMIELGCLLGYYFHYMPVGADPDISLMPTPEQRDQSRKNIYKLRNEKPIFLIDTINDGPLTGGCTSAGRYYVHIHSSGDVSPCVYNNFSTDNITNSSLTEILKSPYLSTLRNTIPFDGNTLRCCIMLDHPNFFFRTLDLHHPHSTIEGEEEQLNLLKSDLKRYSSQMKNIYEPAWKNGDWESIIRGLRWQIESEK
jgi:MoaA/NifB/PqqE/SkfB family radical SAM enzyme